VQANAERFEWLARLGYASRGTVFLILGYFCAVAAWGSTRPLDSHDAFRILLAQPLGGALLLCIAIGLFCLAAWRLIQAVLDADRCGRTLKGCCKRTVYGFAGLFYLAFGGVAVSLLVGLQTVSGDAAARDWTARLLAWSWGQWVVGAVALAIIGTGVGTAVAGVRAEFADRIALPSGRKWIVAALGVIGYLARALVFMMIGFFVFFAAIYANANEATGLAGTLRSIQNMQYGAVLLGITAAGLLSFGAFGLSEAFFRRIPADDKTGRSSWHVM
jgi:hypothetical protein